MIYIYISITLCEEKLSNAFSCARPAHLERQTARFQLTRQKWVINVACNDPVTDGLSSEAEKRKEVITKVALAFQLISLSCCALSRRNHMLSKSHVSSAQRLNKSRKLCVLYDVFGLGSICAFIRKIKDKRTLRG